MQLVDLLAIFTTLFGGTSIFQFYVIWNTRKSTVKQTEATALEGIDAIYTKMTEATNKKFAEMQIIIDSQNLKIFELKNDDKIGKMQTIIESQNVKIKDLEKIVNDYKKKCELCIKNNK